MDRGATGKTIWRLLRGVIVAAVIGAGLAIPVLAASSVFSVPAGPGSPDRADPAGAVTTATSDQGGITAFVTVAGSGGDSDADGVPNATDNCPAVPNGPNQADILGVGNQTNTDADLGASGATIGGVTIGDALGDACDDDDDDDGTSDTVENFVGSNPLDNCPGLPGTGGDAWPPDMFDSNGIINALDALPIVNAWLKADPDPAYNQRADIFDGNGIINALDVLPIASNWLTACT